MTGGMAVQSNSPIGWESLYAGYRWDGASPQMYYVRNRFLLPMIGTWNRRDPLGYSGGDTNLSRYVKNRVASKSDPTGTDDWSPWGIWYRIRRPQPLAPLNIKVDPALNGTVLVTEGSDSWTEYRAEYDQRTHQQLVDEVMKYRPGWYELLFQSNQCGKYVDKWTENLAQRARNPRLVERVEFIRYNFDPQKLNWYDLPGRMRSTTGHVTLYIFLIDGTMIHVDNGAFGGGNQIIERGEIPSSAYQSKTPLPTIVEREFYRQLYKSMCPPCMGF